MSINFSELQTCHVSGQSSFCQNRKAAGKEIKMIDLEIRWIVYRYTQEELLYSIFINYYYLLKEFCFPNSLSCGVPKSLHTRSQEC